MKPIQIMSFLLFLAVAVTVVNLFYRFQDPPQSLSSTASRFITKMEIDPLETVQCPTRGFKCARPDDCDCRSLCSSEEFETFRVLEGDDIIVRDQRMEPGTYCLPRGVSTCNQKTSISVFSASGWMCVPRNRQVFRGDYQIACKNSQAKDNRLNVLWDEATQAPASGVIENFYERLDGGYRYHCKCDSKDVRGNRMVNLMPFACMTDYCVSELDNVASTFGWNGAGCDCGPYEHSDPTDPTSRCVAKPTAVQSDVLEGYAHCMQDDDLMERALFCPGAERMIHFTTRVSNQNRNERILDDFVTSVLPQ